MSPATPGCLATECLMSARAQHPVCVYLPSLPGQPERRAGPGPPAETTGHSYIKYHKRHHFPQIRLFFHASMGYFSILETYLLDVSVVKVCLQFPNFPRQVTERADSCQAGGARQISATAPAALSPGPGSLLSVNSECNICGSLELARHLMLIICSRSLT